MGALERGLRGLGSRCPRICQGTTFPSGQFLSASSHVGRPRPSVPVGEYHPRWGRRRDRSPRRRCLGETPNIHHRGRRGPQRRHGARSPPCVVGGRTQCRRVATFEHRISGEPSPMGEYRPRWRRGRERSPRRHHPGETPNIHHGDTEEHGGGTEQILLRAPSVRLRASVVNRTSRAAAAPPSNAHYQPHRHLWGSTTRSGPRARRPAGLDENGQATVHRDRQRTFIRLIRVHRT